MARRLHTSRRSHTSRSAVAVVPVVGVPLVLACALALMLVWGSAPALAAKAYPLLRTITLPEEHGGPFGDLLPNSVAVDDFSGKTLVADSGTGLIQVFNAAGEYAETWDGSTTNAGSFGHGRVSVAADDATGRVYVFDGTDAVVDVLEASGKYVETWNGSNTPAKSFAPPQPRFGLPPFPDGVTVDQADGDVLVLDREHNVVDIFEPTGSYLKQIKGEPEPIGPLSDGLAVDEATGDVLVSDSGQEFQFGPLGEELPSLTAIETPGGKEAEFSFGGAGTSGSTGNIFVPDINSGRVYIFAADDEYLEDFPRGGLGVTIDQATGSIYVSHDQGEGFPLSGENGVVEVFSGAVTVPPVRVNHPSEEKQAGVLHVTLKGGVEPEGLPLTGCRFEYGTSEAYGHEVTCAQFTSKTIGEGFALVHVSAELPEPQPETTYDYRLVVENKNGQNESTNESFKTPAALGVALLGGPVVEKRAGTIVATLKGGVNPEGEAVKECYFEYGTSLPSGKLAPCEPPAAGLGEGTAPVAVQALASGLEAQQTYLYRLVATDSYGLGETGAGAFETPLAVPSLFVEGYGCAANELFNQEVTLHGAFEPEGLAANWLFEYRKAGTTEAWSKSTGGAANPKDKVLGAEEVIRGLEESTSYRCRLTAENEYGTTEGPEGEFETAQPPVVVSESAVSVGFSGVTLRARINGYGAPVGTRFEYGTSEAYGSSTPEATLAHPVRGEVQVNLPVNGLRPSTVYHFRAVVTQPHGGGTTTGADATFTTFPESSAQLPDGRVYEMVSAVEAQGANVYVPEADNGPYPTPTMMPFQASASGEAVTYVGGPSAGGNGNAGADGGNQYLARFTPAGWVSQDITPPGSISPGYLAFSSDLSTGVLESREPLSPQAPTGGFDDLYTHGGEGGYEPLIAEPPPHRVLPEEFESFGTLGPQGLGLAYAGASADFGRLLFEANDALAPEAKTDPGRDANDLYESAGGQLSLVDVLPGGREAPGATFGAPNESGQPADPPDFSHVISADGSRIFWTDLNTEVTAEDPAGTTRLFVRENGVSTVQVDGTHGGSGPGGGGRFWTASSDGSRVFFTDGDAAGLTASTQTGSGVNLYEYDVPGGELTDLTSAAHAEVLGVVGVNETGEDGSYVYFVAGGVLAGENAQTQESPTAGQPNLYLRHAGVTRFVATLSPEDEGTAQYAVGAGSFGDWEPGLGHRTAELTPDGGSVVFQSVRPLTHYDSENSEGRALAEVFVYDSEPGGGLFCASCDRSGERPPVSEVEAAGGKVKVKAAAYLPVGWSRTYMPRFISEDGSRVFFDTFEPLVAADSNNQQDVYEWERDGEGACAEGVGCDYLLSGATSRTGSYLVDTSANGDDVFFVSDARLVSQDKDESEHLYDDRVEGAPPSSPAGCAGEACVEALSAPPIFAAPPSATFAGVGNFPPSVEAPAKPKRKAKRHRRAKHARKSAAGRRKSVKRPASRKGGRS